MNVSVPASPPPSGMEMSHEGRSIAAAAMMRRIFFIGKVEHPEGPPSMMDGQGEAFFHSLCYIQGTIGVCYG